MNINLYNLPSKDGLNLFIRSWLPEKETRAAILLVHGFSEHSGRYTHWAEKFTIEGFAVYAVDYRGHGKAQGLRGHTPSYKNLLDDIETCIDHISEKYDLPIILYGQSLGGNMVINYDISGRTRLAGIISTSPWLHLVVRPKSIGILLTRVLRKLTPGLIKGTKLDVNLLSHDPQVAIDYEEDPLTHSFITPQLFFGAEKAARKAMKNTGSLSAPLLMMHGTADLVTSYKASKKFAEKAENLGKDITFISWEGLYHELHNEIGNQQVFCKIMEWLNNEILK